MSGKELQIYFILSSCNLQKEKKSKKTFAIKKSIISFKPSLKILGFDIKKLKKITSLNNYTIKENNKYFVFYLV